MLLFGIEKINDLSNLVIQRISGFKK